MTPSAPDRPLVACHDCDVLYELKPLEPGQQTRCVRCGALLYRQGRDVVNRSLAYAVGSLVLFIVSASFPFLSFKILGREQVGFLLTGVDLLNAVWAALSRIPGPTPAMNVLAR